jgi:arsenate reductase
VKVLFMCTANSCRSQMAEAWAHSLFPEPWEAASCGLITYPIAEDTRAAMAEVGVGMEGQYSKSLDQIDLDAFDRVVTLSRSAGQYLPRLHDTERHVHWPVPDPMSAVGDRTQVRAAFARGRDQIRTLVAALAAGLPIPPPPAR